MILIQESVYLSIAEEPRRLNNQPMEGGAGIHVLHNVTSTSKNVHRRRSPDVSFIVFTIPVASFVTIYQVGVQTVF